MAGRLEEVVVTAAGFEQSVVDAPASITLVTHEKLAQQRSHSHSLAEALADVEGIDTGGTAGKTGGVAAALTEVLGEAALADLAAEGRYRRDVY